MELEGVVRNGKIEAKVSRLIRGNAREDVMNIVWTGEVKDDQMIIQRTNSKNVTTTAKLTLSKGKETDDRRGINAVQGCLAASAGRWNRAWILSGACERSCRQS